MANISQLKRKDVKKEVKRIQKLPEYEQKRQMNALCKRVIDEIETTSTRVKIYNRFWDKKKEARKLLSCVMVFPKDYRKFIYNIWDRAFANKVNNTANNVEQIFKTKTAHVCGLPLPEQAEVNVWWLDDMLMLASTATQFSLPIERIMGMGTTWERTAATIGGQNIFLTIEYRKENELKHIVVRATFYFGIKEIKKHYDQKKGAREMNKQEL